MTRQHGWARLQLVIVAGLCIAFAPHAKAQLQTQTNTTSGQVTREVTVENGEVLYVNGNDLVVRMQDGTIRRIDNVPESARATVDGRELGIHELKPGMRLQRTITTTTTPELITTVETVTGTVWHVTPPHSVILTLENGTNQSFKIPAGQKFEVNGNMVDSFGLKKGMKITATRVTEEPVTSISVQHVLAGALPPPPRPEFPLLIVVPRSPVIEVAKATAPAALPKTGSSLPLIGLLGVLAMACSFGIRVARKIA